RWLEEEKEVARWQLQELARTLTLKGVTVTESEVSTGHPAAMIVSKARAIGADLILIGAGKWSGPEPFQPGPAAEAVLQHAAQPVLMVRPGTLSVSFRKILCPVDHSRVSECGLRTAIGLAQAFGGKVHVLSVIPEEGWLGAAWEMGRPASAA